MLPCSGSCRLCGIQTEDQRKRKKRQTVGPYQITKKAVEHDVNGDTSSTWHGPQKLGKGCRRIENRRTNRNHPNLSIIEIGQNTEKSLLDLRRFAMTQALVKGHQSRQI